MTLSAAIFLAASTSIAAAQCLDGSPAWRGGGSRSAAAGDLEHGRRLVGERCAACHGDDGNSPDLKTPKLAGQNPAYLYRQLWAFRTGARTSEIMSGVAAALSDGDMGDAASFFRQVVRPDTVGDPRLAAIGERIFFSGSGSGMAPACAMCHGAPNRGGMPMMNGMMGMMPMMGMMADVPRLDGQHAGYIVDQLTRFAKGERQTMMMGRIAGTLTEMEKRAVAEYLSGRR